MDNLTRKIEETRDKMHTLIESNEQYDKVLKVSQELDDLLVEFERRRNEIQDN